MSFAKKHPKLMEWVRKGGLSLLFSYFVTFLKALLLMFLPDLFRAWWATKCGCGPTSPSLCLA